MDENMAADVLTGTDASAEGADFDGLFDMDGGEVTAEPQETEGQEGAAETQEPEAEPAEGTCADAQPAEADLFAVNCTRVKMIVVEEVPECQG